MGTGQTSKKTITYDYGEEFQDKVVALLVQDPFFLERYHTTIHPDYFDNYHCRELVKIVTDYYYERTKVPKRVRVQTLVDETFASEPKMRKEMRRLVKAAYDMPIGDEAEQISEVVIEFARKRDMEALILQATDKFRDGGSVDSIWELFDRSRNRVAGNQSEEMDVGASLMNTPKICAASGLYNPKMKIATMIPTLDDMLKGGLGRGEVGMIIGDTGRGKSTYLINMGAAAVMQGHPVLHIIVNELKNVDVIMRYSARLTGITCDDIAAEVNVPAYEAAMADVVRTYAPKIKSRRVPSSTTVSMIRSIISRYAHSLPEDRPLGLVLIDDADDLTSRHRASDGYVELGHVYAELKDIADDFNVAIWADSQTNRTAGDAKTIKLGHTGSSYKKPQKADVAVSFNQTDDEVDDEYCRLKLLKARRAKRRKTEVFCKLDGGRMLIHETDPPAEEPRDRKPRRSEREERRSRDDQELRGSEKRRSDEKQDREARREARDERARKNRKHREEAEDGAIRVNGHKASRLLKAGREERSHRASAHA